MDATVTFPVYSLAIGFSNPFFIAANVTVWPARTASPSGSPVSQSSPDGISNANTTRPSRLIVPIAVRIGSRAGPAAPVPSNPSTSKSQSPALASISRPTAAGSPAG